MVPHRAAGCGWVAYIYADPRARGPGPGLATRGLRRSDGRRWAASSASSVCLDDLTGAVPAARRSFSRSGARRRPSPALASPVGPPPLPVPLPSAPGDYLPHTKAEQEKREPRMGMVREARLGATNREMRGMRGTSPLHARRPGHPGREALTAPPTHAASRRRREARSRSCRNGVIASGACATARTHKSQFSSFCLRVVVSACLSVPLSS